MTKNSVHYKIRLGTLVTTIALTGCAEKTPPKPNFIIIFTDDQGYNDLSCFGGNHVNTPNIDQLAEEGIRLTSFYAQPVSTPSRAALITGSYPKRIGLDWGSNWGVLLANDSKGLHPDEITIPEILKEQGYATGIFGKWHLGDQPEFLPTRQGFDEFFGIPYSHDIHPYHPWLGFPPLPLYEGENIIETDPDADYLTQQITQKAVKFIETHKGSPFFLYVPHPLPHVPLHASPPFMEGVSKEIINKLAEEDTLIDYATRDSLFPQVIDEIDWSVGEIIQALKNNKLDKNTLVIFTTDNGPGSSMASAKPLRGRKGSVYEGGVRVPAIVWWPGKIPANHVSDEILTIMDLLPTFALLAGAEAPQDRIIDGKDIWPVLCNQPDARSPHDRYFYHAGKRLAAVRSGKWKLLRSSGDQFELYNLENDISEEINLAHEYPEMVQKLEKYMLDFEEELLDSANIRPYGYTGKEAPALEYKVQMPWMTD